MRFPFFRNRDSVKNGILISIRRTGDGFHTGLFILKIIEKVTMKKCRYCGKELDSNLEFCSSECENSYRKIIEKDRHKIKYFISGIILGFLAMFYGVVSSRNCMIGSGIIVMGVTVVLLPFTTSETTALFGNKKARFIGRILGMILIAVGIWVGFI